MKPSKLYFAAEGDDGPASAELETISKSGQPSSVLLSALSGEAEEVYILLKVNKTGKGSIQLNAGVVNVPGDLFQVTSDQQSFSSTDFHVGTETGRIIAQDDLTLIGSNRVSIGGTWGSIGFMKTIIGGLKNLLLQSPLIRMIATRISMTSSYIELNSPKGKLGGPSGKPIARMGDQITGITSDGKVVSGQITTGGMWTSS